MFKTLMARIKTGNLRNVLNKYDSIYWKPCVKITTIIKNMQLIFLTSFEYFKYISVLLLLIILK